MNLFRPVLNMPEVIQILTNETSLTSVRAGVNPFDFYNSDDKKMIGNFDDTTTRKRVKRLKKQKQVDYYSTPFLVHS